MEQPIHVGYIRWSDPTQADGDSERRQRDTIVADTRLQGINIDRWLDDEGLSASTGENLRKGKLGGFIEEVKSGQIPAGSVLYIDEPSRLTRLGVSTAMRILADLEDAEVSLRLSLRHQTLHGDSLYEILGFIVESAAAHAFTKELGRKVHEAWSAKQEDAREAPGKEVLTSNTPYGILAAGGVYTPGKGWSGRHYDPHPEEAPVVVSIFEMTRDGSSSRQIAIHLNENTKHLSPAASRGKKSKRGKQVWRAETIRDIIKDRVYLDGSYQPYRGTSKKGKVPDGARIVGHYPVFLEDNLWEDAQAACSERFTNRPTSHRSDASNLLTHILKCSHCGGPVSLRSGSDGKRIAALYCINARDGACACTATIHRWRIEAAILAKLSAHLDPERLLADVERAHNVIDRKAIHARLAREAGKKRKDVDMIVTRVLELEGSPNIDMYEGRLTAARQELAELESRKWQIEREIEQADAVVRTQVQAAKDFRGLVETAVFGKPRIEFAGRVDDLATALQEVDRLQEDLEKIIEPARVRLKSAIRKLLDAVTIDLDSGEFVIKLTGGYEFRGSIDEPLRLDGPDDVLRTAYGDL